MAIYGELWGGGGYSDMTIHAFGTLQWKIVSGIKPHIF